MIETLFFQDDGCPAAESYCELGCDNTMCMYCGIGEHCNSVFTNEFSDADKQEILDKHNELRAKVANGNEAGQPGASNMKKLKWSDELASNGKITFDS